MDDPIARARRERIERERQERRALEEELERKQKERDERRRLRREQQNKEQEDEKKNAPRQETASLAVARRERRVKRQIVDEDDGAKETHVEEPRKETVETVQPELSEKSETPLTKPDVALTVVVDDQPQPSITPVPVAQTETTHREGREASSSSLATPPTTEPRGKSPGRNRKKLGHDLLRLQQSGQPQDGPLSDKVHERPRFSKNKFARTIACGSPAQHFFLDYRQQMLDSSLAKKKKQKSELLLTKTRIVPEVPMPIATRLDLEIPKMDPAPDATPTDSSTSSLSSSSSSSSAESVPQAINKEDETKPKTDFEWKPSTERLRDHFRGEGRLEVQSATMMLDMATEYFRRQPNVIQITGPVVVCGDIHGQFFDLVNLLDSISKQYPNSCVLFLGDYVDRGCFSTEVCFYLLAHVFSNPTKFHMLRGNHESRLLTNNFNFLSECLHKYNADVYEAFMRLFDALPLAAVLTSDTKKYFACHGGISPNFDTVDDLNAIDRFMEIPSKGAFCDLMWADPISERTMTGMTFAQQTELMTTDFRPNAVRGCSYEFGLKSITKFLKKNGFSSLIRAHEVKRNGYQEHYFTGKSADYADGPPVMTVFSAPNYCDMYENYAAFVHINQEGRHKWHQIGWDDHPYYLPNFANAFSLCQPILQAAAMQIYKDLLEALEISHENLSTLNEQLRVMRKSSKKMKAQIKPIDRDASQDPFENALRIDFRNEKRPKNSFFRRSTCTW